MATITANQNETSVAKSYTEPVQGKKSISTKIIQAICGMFIVVIASIGIVPPVSADLNLSFVGDLFGTLLQALTDIIPDFESFIDAGFPVLIKVIIYVAIIAIIGLLLYMFRGVAEKILGMIGFK